MSGHSQSSQSLMPSGDKAMTLEQVLDDYHTLTAKATELRLAIRQIREQLELGGSHEWIRRAKKAHAYKTEQLIMVKEQLRAYRALLRTKELIE
jgi:hypothetical protein